MHVCVCFCALWQTLERNFCLDQILFLWSQIDYGMKGVGVRVTWNGMHVALVSQCVAGCCKVLQQGVAGCCRVLQGVAGCCRVLLCVAVCCDDLKRHACCFCIAIRCRVLQGVAGTRDYLKLLEDNFVSGKIDLFHVFHVFIWVSCVVLRCVALCSVVLHCNMLHCVAVCCSVLQRIYLSQFRCGWIDMTHSYVRRDSCTLVTWLIHMCDMTHSYVWHDLFICVQWLTHTCNMTWP